jgi:hypothetical protein
VIGFDETAQTPRALNSVPFVHHEAVSWGPCQRALPMSVGFDLSCCISRQHSCGDPSPLPELMRGNVAHVYWHKRCALAAWSAWSGGEVTNVPGQYLFRVQLGRVVPSVHECERAAAEHVSKKTFGCCYGAAGLCANASAFTWCTPNLKPSINQRQRPPLSCDLYGKITV